VKLSHVFAVVFFFGLILAIKVALRGEYEPAVFIFVFSLFSLAKAIDPRSQIRIDWAAIKSLFLPR